MRFDPRPWLVEHWPIKLAAIVLALVVWVAVAASRQATQMRPVEVIIELPQGRGLTQPLPNVSALVSGRVNQLIDLYRRPLRIHKAVFDTSASGIVTISLRPGDVVLPPDVAASVLDVQPREIRITLDQVVRRRVRVTPRVSIRPDSGFVLLGGVTVLPSEVEVSGSRRIVDAITEIPTLSTDIVNARAPIERQVPLDLRDMGTVVVTPAEVLVSADVAVLTERTFANIAVEVESSALVPDPVTVTLLVRGPAPRLARFTADSFAVSASIPRGAAAGDSVTLFSVAPLGITALPTPGTVVLRRRSS